MAVKQQRLSNGRVVWAVVGTDKWAATEAKALEIDARVHGRQARSAPMYRQPDPDRRAHEALEDMPPAGFTWFDNGDPDYICGSYEMAMAAEGDYAYKIIGRVEPGTPKERRLYTLHESYEPERTLVIVSTDGHGYNVGFYDDESPNHNYDIARGIPDVRDAIYLATFELNDARRPAQAARYRDERAYKLKRAYGPYGTQRP